MKMPKKKRRVPPITPEEEKLAEDALLLGHSLKIMLPSY